MSPDQYKMRRKAIGTQREVAVKLGIHPMTVTKRECGTQPISQEAELAILSLIPKSKSK
jgi:hypothetical protein